MRGKAGSDTCPRVTKKQLLASECEPSRSPVSLTPCFPLVVSGEECTEAPLLQSRNKDRGSHRNPVSESWLKSTLCHVLYLALRT